MRHNFVPFTQFNHFSFRKDKCSQHTTTSHIEMYENLEAWYATIET